MLHHPCLWLGAVGLTLNRASCVAPANHRNALPTRSRTRPQVCQELDKESRQRGTTAQPLCAQQKAQSRPTAGHLADSYFSEDDFLVSVMYFVRCSIHLTIHHVTLIMNIHVSDGYFGIQREKR